MKAFLRMTYLMGKDRGPGLRERLSNYTGAIGRGVNHMAKES
jgi:hypothetical protein